MLVAAFADHDFIKLAYKKAKKKNYGFLSYGDCMLII
jgi:S-adenosylmethionine:tRNA ribosyltransferase-isomerase